MKTETPKKQVYLDWMRSSALKLRGKLNDPMTPADFKIANFWLNSAIYWRNRAQHTNN